MENFGILEQKMKEIKEKGWVEGIKTGSSSIGMTFEKLLGKPVDNFELPDYLGIEIKTKKIGSNSHITLFNATPDSYLFEIARLKNNYGYPDQQLPQFKVLNVSVYANKDTPIKGNYYFRLQLDYINKKLVLKISNHEGNIIEHQVSWTFELLKEKLFRKLQYLALIKAEKKYSHHIQYFKYQYADYYKLRGFKEFLYLISVGKIRVTFSVGIFKSGKRYGETYDHGTSFNIREEDLIRLFYKIN